jgi:ribosomal protein S18 acetylase RimI-like enzyme
MANALNRHEKLPPHAFTPAIVRRDAFGRRRAFRVLVAEVDGRVVGYASFLPGYNTDIARPEFWMLDLFVGASWRSRGIGRALVASVARATVRRGFACLEWGVRGDNRRAKKFYHSLGARVGNSQVAGLFGRALTALATRR